MKSKCILLFLLLSMCLLVHAQNRYGRYIGYQLTLDDGLPSNSITDIAQDDDGFVWIGTANGLCRYDGYAMLVYRSMSTNQEENTDSHVAYLDFDAKRKLLKVITTEKTWSYYSTQKGRFVKYDSKWHKTIEPFDRFSMKFEGKLIANTAGCGIVGNYKYVTDKDGNVYFYPKVGKPFKFHLIENSHVVTSRWNKFRVAQDKQGNLYIASYGEGLFIYHPQTKQMEHLTVKNSNGILISDFLTAVMVDNRGMVWVGNDDAGVTCISSAEQSLSEYLYLEPNNRFGWNNYVRCLAKRKDGSYFIGSSVGEGYAWNPATAIIRKIKNFPSTVTSCVEAHDGSVWVGTRGAGFYVDDVHYSTKDKEHYCPSDLIHYMVEDAKGRMWIATYEGGLLLAERTPQGKLRIKQFLTRSLDESRIHCLLIDKQGILWIASKHGIYKVDTKQNTFSNDSFINFSKKNSPLPGDEIPVLYQAKNGTFWAGIVGQGLAHLKFETDKLEVLAQLNASTGIRMNAVFSIVEDLQGNIWVGTEQGLVQIDIKQLTVKTYNLAPTFMGNVFTERCAALLADGSLAFGTKDGLLVMRGVKALGQQQTNKCIVFSDLLVNGNSIFNASNVGGLHDISLTKASKVELKYGQNSLTICYSDLDYFPSTLSLFQYYLEGHDRNWRPATTEKKAVYDELEPGHYVFHVRQASGNKGQENKEYTLEIVIHQPWYNTWWAWIGYILMIAVAGGYVFHSLRERALLNHKIKIEEELMDFKLRFFTNITHEFRTPLAIIQTAVDKMRECPGQTASRNSLATAQRGVKRLQRLVNQLMEFRKMNAGAMTLHVCKGDIILFVRQIYQDIWQIANQKGIHMTFVPFAQHHEMLFDERAVEMVVYNLLSNAMKYTPSGGSVTLTIQQDAGTLVISVADTGKGISKEQEARLFQPFMQGVVSQGGMGIGLYMAHAMAQLHHGSLTYHRQEQGSLFIAQIPMADEAYTETEKEGKDLAIQTAPEKDAYEDIVMENLPDSINDCKVAIVEDDFDMMGQMKEELGKYFKLETFVDGESAVKDMSDEVALVLCDVMLPGMDGYEVVKRIKTKHQHLPAIMLTALNDDRHQIKGYQAGADDYMLKPCNFKVLLARIVQLIKWSRQVQASENLAKVQGEAKATDAAERSQAQEETPPQLLTSLQDKRFLQKLASTVASHVMDPNFSMDDLAAALHMGRSKFYGKVKDLTGLSPSKYILKYRMEEAARLLEADEMTIAEISYQVGIQEPSYFYRCFKSYFGMSPSEYKKNGAMKK